jgi:hypothetical protein
MGESVTRRILLNLASQSGKINRLNNKPLKFFVIFLFHTDADPETSSG